MIERVMKFLDRRGRQLGFAAVPCESSDSAPEVVKWGDMYFVLDDEISGDYYACTFAEVNR